MKNVTTLFPTATQNRRRVCLDAGILVLPPTRLRELPPNIVIGSFMGIPALRFTTWEGPAAMFLHDLHDDDLAEIMKLQRRQAEAQFGARYSLLALEFV